MYDTILIDGVDVKSLAGVRLDAARYAASWTMAPSRGEPPASLGADGETDVDRPVTALMLPVALLVESSSQTILNDRIAALRAWCKPRQAVTLVRRVGHTAGDQDHTGAARLEVFDTEPRGPVLAAVTVEFRIAAGYLYGSAVAIASVAGVQTITGEASTHKMTLTLAAGAARTVTNTTNGHWFTFGTTVPTGGILVDVEAQTATAITGGADYSGYLSWGKTYPFRLNPGSNTLTVSAGSASISYQPAYL